MFYEEFEIGVLFHDRARSQYRDHDWRLVVSVDGREILHCAVGREETEVMVEDMEFEEAGQVM